jgi:hypothetical protein
VEQQPEPRTTVGIDAFIPSDDGGDLVAVGVTIAFPKGRGLEAATAVHSLVHQNVGELIKAVLLDDATRRRVQDAALEQLIGKAMES